MTLDPPTERDLLADAGADGRRQPDLGQVGLDGDDAAAGRQRADVHHEHLGLAQLGNLDRGQMYRIKPLKLAGMGKEAKKRPAADYQLQTEAIHHRELTCLGPLLVSLCAHAEQPPEEVVADLELRENVWESADRAEHLNVRPCADLPSSNRGKN